MSEEASATRFNVLVPDVEYYQKLVRCQSACPVRTDSRGYVTAIAAGEYEKAYLIAREANPFVSVCGRVCNAPCEAAGACRRGEIDEAVAIRALKRFVTERHGVESRRHLPKVRESFDDAPMIEERRVVDQWPGNHGTAQSRAALRKLQERGGNGSSRDPRATKVAVLGAGPAGLSCAHDLAILGYEVTVFEASPVAGGMMRLGIPEYRLPRDILNLEIQTILDMGVELRLNTRVGPSLGLTDLRESGFEAVFIAIGAHKSRDLRIDGVELDGVLRAVDFLLNVNLGYRVELGDRVTVIGGGPVAFDVARSVRRLEAIQSPATDEDLTSAVEVARMALRRGAKEVHMICLESREEMPAPEVEIEEGLEEGIILHTRRGPKRITGDAGRVAGLETIRVASVFDSDGRFNPTFLPATESVLPCDTVIMAIGQAPDFSFIQEQDGIEITRQGTVAVDRESLATTAPGIYAGGDAAFGPRILIDAVADGQRAARSIHSYLQGRRLRVVKRGRMTVVKPEDYLYSKYLTTKRRKVPNLPLERRIGISEVELGYAEEQAVEQGQRCLKCHVQTIFDGSKCILCGLCVDACPSNCLRLVRLNRITGDLRLSEVVRNRYGFALADVPEGGPKFNPLSGNMAMIKDESRCVRCALCQIRCPVDAITMEAFHFVEDLTFEESGLQRAPERMKTGGRSEHKTS